MKKLLPMVLIALVILALGTALAVPELSSALINASKQAAGCLASGEYERLVTLLPFSGDAPSAAEWERFARSYADLSAEPDGSAVAYWRDGSWRIAVPMQPPEHGGVEALLLQSEDGESITGYKYATWAQVKNEMASSEHIALE